MQAKSVCMHIVYNTYTMSHVQGFFFRVGDTHKKMQLLDAEVPCLQYRGI